jgi:hypothetical protein
MKTASQPILLGVRDWREPQTVPTNGLAGIIREAGKDGFEAVRMETSKKPFGYRVTFQRKPALILLGHPSGKMSAKANKLNEQSTC